MKKNAMLKIAAILMVAVLLTTCAISSTFAKYVSNPGELTAKKATVAKWGINITATKAAGEDLFLDTYNGDDGVTVKAGTAEALVLAPGTSNNASPFSVEIEFAQGRPEVDFNLTANVEFEIGDNWKDKSNAFYCPLVITIGGTTKVNGLDYADAEAFEDAVEDAYAAALHGREVDDAEEGKYVVTYHCEKSNTEQPLPSVDADKTAITWNWAFTGATSTDNTKTQSDEADTALGNAGLATIDFKFSVSAEQID